MVLYGITFNTQIEELQEGDLGIITPFYADDTAFDSLVRRTSQIMKVILEWGADMEYFHEPAKYFLISESPAQEAEARREFEVEGLQLNFFSNSKYLEAYLGTREELEA